MALTHTVADPEISKGGSRRQCIRPVAIYCKYTELTICPLYGKKQLIEKNSDPVGDEDVVTFSQKCTISKQIFPKFSPPLLVATPHPRWPLVCLPPTVNPNQMKFLAAALVNNQSINR